MRHFTVVTAVGREEIYCEDLDDAHENELWFIFKDHSPKIFQRVAVISYQEQPPPDPKAWERLAKEQDDAREPTYDDESGGWAEPT